MKVQSNVKSSLFNSFPSRYGYAVQDDEGNDFNQQEQSDGEQVKTTLYVKHRTYVDT